MQANAAASTKLEDVLREEREQAATDRQTLLSQITNLVMAQGETQDARLGIKIADVAEGYSGFKRLLRVITGSVQPGDGRLEREGRQTCRGSSPITGDIEEQVEGRLGGKFCRPIFLLLSY